MDRPVTNQDLFNAVASWLRANYPGERGVRFYVKLEGRRRLVALPLPNGLAHHRGEPAPPFEPSAFQVGILDALAGKALRVEAIIAVVKDKPRFYRDPGGIKELERQGLVQHNKRVGYYRPDAPPPEMEEG